MPSRTYDESMRDLWREHVQRMRSLSSSSWHAVGKPSSRRGKTEYTPFRRASQTTYLDKWMLPDGEFIPIRNMTRSQLTKYIRLIKSGKPCGKQRNKIISLERRLASVPKPTLLNRVKRRQQLIEGMEGDKNV